MLLQTSLLSLPDLKLLFQECRHGWIKNFHHINYSFIQGFPALRKAVTTHNFSRLFDIAHQQLTRLLPSVPFPVRLMKEQQSFYHSQSLVVCWNFIGSWLLKHWKVRIVYRQWRSNFPKGEENQNTKRKTESYVLFCFGKGICCRWESTTRRFATSHFFLCTWKISSVGKDRVKKLRILYIKDFAHCCFCNELMQFFYLKP